MKELRFYPDMTENTYLVNTAVKLTYTTESPPAGRRRVYVLAAFTDLISFRLVVLFVERVL